MTQVYKSFAEIPPIFKKEEPKKTLTRIHPETEPVFLNLLKDALGTNSAAEAKIGLSSTLVATDLRRGQTRVVNELAAKAIYELEIKKQEPEAKPSNIVVSMKIDRAAWEVIRPWLEGAGANISVFEV